MGILSNADKTLATSMLNLEAARYYDHHSLVGWEHIYIQIPAPDLLEI